PALGNHEKAMGKRLPELWLGGLDLSSAAAPIPADALHSDAEFLWAHAGGLLTDIHLEPSGPHEALVRVFVLQHDHLPSRRLSALGASVLERVYCVQLRERLPALSLVAHVKRQQPAAARDDLQERDAPIPGDLVVSGGLLNVAYGSHNRQGFNAVGQL